MQSDRSSGGSKRPIPDAAYLERLGDQAYRPIFVLGDHRSGTTILYRLLAMSGAFNYLTLYHTLDYDELLSNHIDGREDAAKAALVAKLESLGIKDRVIDNMEVGPDYQDEYCFILVTRGQGFKLRPKNFKLFDEICRKIQFISEPERPLLLKNPFDFANFLYIREAIPTARFVFIHRHPVDILNSMLRAVRTSWHDGNPLNQLRSDAYRWAQHNGLFMAVMRWLTGPGALMQPALPLMSRRIDKHCAYYRDHINELPSSDYVSLRYEDLCREPNEQIARILDFVGVEPRRTIDYRELIQPRALKRLPDITRIEDRLNRRFARILDYHGYTS